MFLRIRYTVQVHGMPSEWIRKERTTGHVRVTDRFINNDSMENKEEIPKLELEHDTLKDLDTTRKWTMFLAILGFIGIGVFLTVGLFGGIFLSVFNKGDTATSYPGWLFIIIIIVTSILYFFPMLYIFRFSKFISVAIKTCNKEELKKAFKNLKSYFIFLGILFIAILVIYVIAIMVMGTTVKFLN